ncbi:MAG: Hsp70 family protein [Deltaproteobacteria bacterium]|nr:Hsp70 family protein [Deltaproteobacteria bacterium]
MTARAPASKQPATRAVGIDLGTSNSVVAVIDRDGAPRILTTAEGSTTLPSIVWFSPDGPVVGEPARAGLDHSPDITVFGAKRLLGRRFDHPEIKKLSRILPYQLIEAPNGDTWIELAPGRSISPEEACALVLRELRRMAEAHFGAPVTRAVITIPAWYDAAQRQATKDAAHIAGLQTLRLLSEPTAAAFGHGAHRGHNCKYLVCDLGGGTFDVAAVDVEAGIFEVLATTGDSFLGGDDIDRAIVENLVRDVRHARGFDISTDAVAIERLRIAAQAAKHELSGVAAAKVAIPELAQLPSGKAVEYGKLVRRDEVELWAAPLLRRLEGPMRDALKRAGRAKGDVQEVLLVGGMTRMPAVRREIARVVGREPRVIENPEEVVAVGAALEVARLEGAIEGVLLIDVAARGLAVSMAGGECEAVIAQSAVVPTREHRVFATRVDDQPRIEFDVWEGESADPSRNRHLGRYAILDLPPAPAGDVLVLVELTLDTDGTVRLGASELVSGERLQLEQLFHAGLPRADVSRLARQLAEAP